MYQPYKMPGVVRVPQTLGLSLRCVTLLHFVQYLLFGAAWHTDRHASIFFQTTRHIIDSRRLSIKKESQKPKIPNIDGIYGSSSLSSPNCSDHRCWSISKSSASPRGWQSCSSTGACAFAKSCKTFHFNALEGGAGAVAAAAALREMKR